MSATTAVPLTITPEAAARVAELGMQAAVERMIEHTRASVPGLRRVEVVLDPPYDTGDDPYLTIRAFRPLAHRLDDGTRQAWGRWKVTSFSPEVCRHITLTLIEGREQGAPILPPDVSLPVPVVLKPGAGERIEDLGMHAEFRQILEHAGRAVPGLVRIEVGLAQRYDTGGEPAVTIDAVTDRPVAGDDRTDRDLRKWVGETFPPEVREHFFLCLRPEESHAG
jgi:hypothetical protein